MNITINPKTIIWGLIVAGILSLVSGALIGAGLIAALVVLGPCLIILAIVYAISVYGVG